MAPCGCNIVTAKSARFEFWNSAEVYSKKGEITACDTSTAIAAQPPSPPQTSMQKVPAKASGAGKTRLANT